MISSRLTIIRVLILLVTVLGVINCAKKKSNTRATTTASAGYIICPPSGSYNRQGMILTCQPGQQVYVGGIGNQGYNICPQQGFYMQNGMSFPCNPGSTYYNNNNINGTANNGNACAAQYGPEFGPVVYNGQVYCDYIY